MLILSQTIRLGLCIVLSECACVLSVCWGLFGWVIYCFYHTTVGPILFLLYIEAMQDIVEPYGLRIKLYADDSQLYVSLVPTDSTGWSEAKVDIEECLAKVKRWMVGQWLK